MTKESHHDSAGQRLFQRPASGLRPGQQQSHAFASRATTSCALAAPVARRVILLRPRSGGSRIGLPPGLHYGRRCSALLIVLDLRCVWLSAFSIVILSQARLRAGVWWGGRLGHNDAPSSSGPPPSRLQAGQYPPCAKPRPMIPPNSSRNFSFAASRVCFRWGGRFRPARLM